MSVFFLPPRFPSKDSQSFPSLPREFFQELFVDVCSIIFFMRIDNSEIINKHNFLRNFHHVFSFQRFPAKASQASPGPGLLAARRVMEAMVEDARNRLTATEAVGTAQPRGHSVGSNKYSKYRGHLVSHIRSYYVGPIIYTTQLKDNSNVFVKRQQGDTEK